MFVQTANYAVVDKDRLVLKNVDQMSQWFLNRPERSTGTVETWHLVHMLHMRKPERAVNADITYMSYRDDRPRSNPIMLWDPVFDYKTTSLSDAWKPLGNNTLLPPYNRGGKVQLQSVSLFIDSCPSSKMQGVGIWKTKDGPCAGSPYLHACLLVSDASMLT